jgi:hypothetical protein
MLNHQRFQRKENNMKRVAILTTFTNVDTAYSLIGVVQNQIRMLVANGYKPVVIVKQGFRAEETFALPQVELRYIPVVPASNYISEAVDTSFKADVEKLKVALIEDLKDVDVVLTHDLIYQPESRRNFCPSAGGIALHPCSPCQQLHIRGS